MSMQMKVTALHGSHCCAAPHGGIVCSLPPANLPRPSVGEMHKLDVLECDVICGGRAQNKTAGTLDSVEVIRHFIPRSFQRDYIYVS